MRKRVFDIFISIAILSLFFWILLLCWLIAILDTKSNGVFIQERIGQFGKVFKIYKFRTISINNNSGKIIINRVGRILRKYKLDELPQIFNVIRGEMSIVGPRPDIIGYYNLLEGENRKILELKPGLTGVASLKYFQEEALLQNQENSLLFNDEVIYPDKVKMNLEYYYNHSLSGDMGIIIKTIQLVIFRK